MSFDGGTRADMVEAARKFMLTPKVRDTPFEEQRQFLVAKGLTEAEITEARESIPAGALAPSQQPMPGHPGAYMGPPPPGNRLVTFAQSALVIGSVSYAGYRFLRSYVLPRFFDIPDPATEELRQLQLQVNELQNSIKFVMDSVSQTTQTLAIQQQEMSRALLSVTNRDVDIGRVEAGISTIKSLLLSHNNFAPIAAPAVNLPSWQQSLASSSIPANAASMRPATQHAKSDDDDEFVDSLAETNSGKISPV